MREAMRCELGARSAYPLLARAARDEELRRVLRGLADEQRKIVEELEAAMSALGEQPRTRSLRRSLAAWGLFLASPVLGLRFALRMCYHAEGRVGRWYHGYSAWLAEHAALESARTFQRLSLEKRRHAQVLETFVEHSPARWRR